MIADGSTHDLAARARATNAFVEDIGRAISLRDDFFQHKIDQDFQKGGGRIFWAIDPAVINAYFRVGHDGPEDSSDSEAYADYRVFSEPASSPALDSDYPGELFDILVGSLLGPGDPNASGRSVPLLLLPGHTGEAKHAYDNVVQGFQNAVESKRPRERLSAFLDALENMPVAERPALAEARQPELHKILYGLYDAHQKFRTFSTALAERRLVTVKGALLHESTAYLADIRKSLALAAEGKLKTLDDQTPGSEDYWGRKLKPMPKLYADSDKVALARLYELNKLLFNRNSKIVLVTDNNLILATGRAFTPVKHEHTPYRGNSFSDLYIRHPKTFLAERKILLPNHRPDAPVSMTAWLDAFLAKIEIKGRVDDIHSFRAQVERTTAPRRLHSLARHALERSPAIHESICGDWHRHVRNVLVAHVSTTSEAISRFLRQLKVEERDRADVLREFEGHVAALTEASWSEFFLTAAKSGYELIGITSDRTAGRMRNVPILYLRDLPSGEEVLALVYDTDGVIRHEVEIRRILDSLDTANNAADFYVAALSVSLLFAYADRWVIAHALANRAVEIGRRELEALRRKVRSGVRQQGMFVTGREASYLASVTGRLTARSIDDLERCKALLAQFTEALDFERNELELPPEFLGAYPPITGLRVAAEKVAIETARLSFHLAATAWKPGDEVTRARVEENVRAIYKVMDEAGDCLAEPVYRSSMVNLRLNLFSNWFLLETLGELDPAVTAEAKAFVRAQVDDILGDGTCQRDVAPIDAYAMLYAASFVPGLYNELVDDHAWAASRVATVKPREASLLMPYDREKCQRMMALAAGRVS